MDNNPKILICGNYGATNLGDESILDGILNNIEKTFKKTEVTVLSYNPSRTSQMHNIHAAPLFPMGISSLFKGIFKLEIAKTLREIKKCDIFILGGGGLFTDEKLFAIFLWGWHGILAKIFKKPLYIYANSVGPLNTKVGRFITRYLFQKAQIITVRDEKSAETVKKIKVKIRPQITTDPALALNIKNKKSIQKYPYVVVNLRPWIKKISNLEKNMANLINEITFKYKLKVILLPFQTKHDNDKNILSKIFTQVEQKNMVKIANTNDEYQKAIDLIQNAEIFIGMRLHGLIFALLTKTPFISLSYSPKVRNFCKMINMEKYCIDLSSLKYKEIEDLFEKAWKSREEIRQNLGIQKEILKKREKENVRRLRSFFKKQT